MMHLGCTYAVVGGVGLLVALVVRVGGDDGNDGEENDSDLKTKRSE